MVHRGSDWREDTAVMFGGWPARKRSWAGEVKLRAGIPGRNSRCGPYCVTLDKPLDLPGLQFPHQ